MLVLISGLLILVIGALITARWIVRPIERLSRTARAPGLRRPPGARSKLDRADEIGELGHRFDEMADRIAGLLATEKELLANVAHELRTPLTRIGVALDLANEGDAEAARASRSSRSRSTSPELETIVDDHPDRDAVRDLARSGRPAAAAPRLVARGKSEIADRRRRPRLRTRHASRLRSR